MPVLDSGLPDALATLAAASALPVELRADVPVRPTEAIETFLATGLEALFLEDFLVRKRQP